MIQFTSKKRSREDLSIETARVLRVKKFAHFLSEIVMDARANKLHPFEYYVSEHGLKCLSADAVNPILAMWSDKGLGAVSATDVIKASENLADTHNARGARFVK